VDDILIETFQTSLKVH